MTQAPIEHHTDDEINAANGDTRLTYVGRYHHLQKQTNKQEKTRNANSVGEEQVQHVTARCGC